MRIWIREREPHALRLWRKCQASVDSPTPKFTNKHVHNFCWAFAPQKKNLKKKLCHWNDPSPKNPKKLCHLNDLKWVFARHSAESLVRLSPLVILIGPFTQTFPQISICALKVFWLSLADPWDFTFGLEAFQKPGTFQVIPDAPNGTELFYLHLP